MNVYCIFKSFALKTRLPLPFEVMMVATFDSREARAAPPGWVRGPKASMTDRHPKPLPVFENNGVQSSLSHTFSRFEERFVAATSSNQL